LGLYGNEYNSSDYSKKGRNEFWYKCISDSGLEKLKPIELGSYFVDISTIRKNELKIILETKLKDVDLSNYEEYLGQISGGIVIIENGIIIIEPSCCGDLSDIKNWEDIKQSNKEWKQLWIGHPWLFYRQNNENIYISDYTDFNLKDFKDIFDKHQFSKSEFVSQIELVRENQKEFQKNISEILTEMKIKNSNEIAKILVGN
jgi:hypothetical protein